MSWSFNVLGTPETVKREVSAQCEKIAQNYAGKAEADDVLVVRDRVCALVDSLAMGTEYGVDFNGVEAKANGSHSVSQSGLGAASAQFSVTRIHLAL